MAIHESEGLVLNRYPLGENDRIFTIYTSQFGKLRVIARGAMKTRSLWISLLEPFNCIHVILFHKQGQDLYRLNRAESVRRYPAIQADLNRLSAAFEILEILDRFTMDGDANPPIYALTADIFDKMNDPSENPQLWLRIYSILFFKSSGYNMQVSRCSACNKFRGNHAAYFVLEDSSIRCQKCLQSEKTPPKTHLISGHSLDIIDRTITCGFQGEDYPPEVLDKFLTETKPLITAGFAYHFGQIPHSRHLFTPNTEPQQKF